MQLLDLSNELLDQILENFVPGIKSAQGLYPSRGVIAEGVEWDSPAKPELHALAATNRRLNAVATPYLYHTIHILQLHHFFPVLRSLICNDRLARHVRALNIDTILSPELLVPEDLKIYTARNRPFARKTIDNITEDMRAHGYLKLCFGEGLDVSNFSRTIRINRRNYPDGYNALKGVFDTCRARGIPLIENLSTLCIGCDLHCAHGLLPNNLPQQFIGSRNVKQLMRDKDDNRKDAMKWIDRHPKDEPFNPAPWRNLEVVELTYSVTTGAWWYRLCKKARPKLRSITIDLTPSCQPSRTQRRGYNEALQLCADSLEYLWIELPEVDEYDSQLGLTETLSCLPSLSKLRHLRTRAVLVLKSGEDLEHVDIRDRLPPSLEVLYLDDAGLNPWYRYGADDEGLMDPYPQLMKRSMLNLIMDSEHKLPMLRKVVLSLRGSPSINKTLTDCETMLKGYCHVTKEGKYHAAISAFPRQAKGVSIASSSFP
ncbi:hypothetical protein OQA88_823 [Cercophora sp. LCS_1]